MAALTGRGRNFLPPSRSHGTQVALSGGLVGGLLDRSMSARNEQVSKGQRSGGGYPRLTRRSTGSR